MIGNCVSVGSVARILPGVERVDEEIENARSIRARGYGAGHGESDLKFVTRALVHGKTSNCGEFSDPALNAKRALRRRRG